MLKIEFQRAFFSKRLLIAIIAGCAITLYQIYLYQSINDNTQTYETAIFYEKDLMMQTDFLWGSWIGGETMLFNGFLFFLVFPILASFPFANSYMQDEKNGYMRSVFTRISKSTYFLAKWLATFFSGGVAVTIPLVFNFVIMTMIYPIVGPFVESGVSGVLDVNTFSSLFYKSPLLYVVLFILIIFVFGGSFSTFSLIVSFFTDYSFIILLFPFLIIMFLSMLLELFDLADLSPQVFLYPAQSEISVSILWLLMIALISVSLIYFFYANIKGEKF